MASNIGSTATITGNPQNIIIGSLSRIPYGTFARALSPIAAIGMLITIALTALFFREEFWTSKRLPREELAVTYHGPLVIASVSVTVVMVVLFFLGQPAAKVAILAGGLLLLSRRVKASKVYREIDWPLLMMFAGLFIVVAGLEHAVLTPQMLAQVRALHLENTAVLSTVTAVL